MNCFVALNLKFSRGHVLAFICEGKYERDDGNANQGSTDPLSQLVEDAEMIVM